MPPPDGAHASFPLFHNQISVHITPEAAKRGGGEEVGVERGGAFIQQDYECMTSSSLVRRGMLPA